MATLTPYYFGFILVLVRCAAVCSVAPLFGTLAVPLRVRVGLALALALAVYNGGGTPSFAAWDRTASLAVAVAQEILIGVGAALAARFAVEALIAAGHAISLEMGIGFSAVVDPIHGTQSTALSEILAFTAVALAIATGFARDVVAWLARSVVATPPGADMNFRELIAAVVGEAARAGSMAIRLAMPVMAGITFGHIAIKIVSRVAPQLNLSNVGFSLAIVAGGFALYLAAPAMAELTARSVRAAFIGG